MIPKIIHLCWLSGDKYPESIKQCLNTWHEKLPDYEIWLWDTKRFDINSTLWTKQAFNSKKYAFAADYIRLYALYNYGGIYLDSDVWVYKSFNELLNLPYFIGQCYNRCFEAAIIGAERRSHWIKHILDYYTNRPFIMADGAFDMKTLPVIFYERLVGKYKFVRLTNVCQYHDDNEKLYIFSQDFFNSRNSIKPRRTRKSFCAHNYATSWRSNEKSLVIKVVHALPKWLVNIYFTITHNTIKKKKSRRYEIPF